MDNFFEKKLINLKEQNNWRCLRDVEKKDGKYIFLGEKKYLNLSSNDYLGVASNPDISKAFLQNCPENHFGSGSARLLAGGTSDYKDLEMLLASLYKKEKALLFNSGYHANIGILSALAGKKDVIFSDKLNHASIVDGMVLSRSKFFRYKHLAYENLENILKEKRKDFEKAFIVTESVFSMDGDIANLQKLVELKKKYNCFLIVDEAHGFGVFGENGLGVCERDNIIDEIDLIVGTFGKSVGSIGAFCVGDEQVIDYLVNTARSFIFTTSLPPVNIAFSKWSVENVLLKASSQRKKILKTSDKLRKSLLDYGLVSFGESQIVPVIIGGNEETVLVAKALQDKGFYIGAIRPPTIPENSSRLRISLTSEIEWEDIKDIPKLIKEAVDAI